MTRPSPAPALTLTRALRLPEAPCVAIVGAGGKTTVLYWLAREFGRAIVTTTTHLGEWQAADADRHIVWSGDTFGGRAGDLGGAGVTLVTGPVDRAAHRWRGLPDEAIGHLRGLAARLRTPLLIEADGSRQRSLKAPAAHEPAIPPGADEVIVVAGLGALGRPLSDEHVHRPEIFAELAALRAGEPITAEAVARVLSHPEGGLKHVPPGAGRAVLLTEADTEESRAHAAEIARRLLAAFDAVIVSGSQPATVGGGEPMPAARRPCVIAVHPALAFDVGTPEDHRHLTDRD